MGERALPPQVLSIAGSDSGAGAGLQADLKAIHANGGYALTVVTAVTAQNTTGVLAARSLPIDLIRSQIEAVFADFDVAAVKTGMLGDAEVVGAVAEELQRRRVERLVVDPVMVATSGHALIDDPGVGALKSRLLPLARLCTPNLREAEVLSGRSIGSRADAREAARRILALGPRAVLIKGGHLDEHSATDLLIADGEEHLFEAERIATTTTHGTGCTLASAIAAWLARGADLVSAVAMGKRFVDEAIRHGLRIGHGHGPTDPFFFLHGRDWTHFAKERRS